MLRRRPSALRAARVLILLLVVSSALLAGRAGAGTLAGMVLDPSGTPVPGARVLVTTPLTVLTTSTDATGGFEFADLPDGLYRVSADVPGFSAAPADVQVTGTGAQVQLRLAVAPVRESLVVSAAQVERPLSVLSPSVSVAEAEDLRARQAAALDRALRPIPGMGFVNTGGPGALTSIFPRGGESDYTLVLVDGLRVNAFGGGFDASQLALTGADRIEVVRGPQSALYGADAIGGVVQVVTRHGGPTRLQAVAEGGSRATTRVGAAGAGSAGPLGWSGSVERSASDGFTGTAPASGEAVTNDDWRMRQAAGSLSWQFSPEALLRVDARTLDSERGYPGPYGSNPIGAFPGMDRVSRGDTRQRQAGITAAHAWASGAMARQRYSASWSDLDSGFASPFGPSIFETRRTAARTQTDLAFGPASSVSAGVEAWRERARSTYITGERFQEIPIERRLVGLFAEWRQDAGRSLAFTGGLRFEHIRRDPLEGHPSPFGPRPAFAADVQRTVNPRAAVTWALARDGAGAPAVRLHAAFGTGMRPPDAFEIAFTDNPALQPERSRSFEAGATHEARALGARFSAVVFRNDYDDLIVAVGRSLAGASRYRTDNISNARAQGLELGAVWRAPWGLRARAAYTWLETEILGVDRAGLAPPPFSVGDALVRRPRHQGSLDLLFARGRTSAFAEVGARGRTLDIEPNFGAFGGLFENPGFAVVDAGGAVEIGGRVQVFGRVTNLLGHGYEEALGFPAPGRLAMVGVRLAHGR